MSIIKLSDYVFSFLADYGVRHVFLVTGGGSMHLNDSLGKEKRLRYICNHHEQACSIAAEGYSRVTGKIGVINVTTGPGGINAINGVFGAWTDSIPMLVISGQVKRETCLASYNVPQLRQLGDQEVDIIGMVKGITKYSVLIKDPLSIRYHLERALYFATSGRPGPCWIDIPLDVQASKIETDDLPGYNPEEDAFLFPQKYLSEICTEVLNRLQKAERPVVMAGTGVRIAGAMELFKRVADKLGIPVALSWTSPDIVANDDPLYCGRAGTIGDRAGNFTVQNSDLLLVLGSRLNIRQISYNWQSFARNAFKIQVDADLAEMTKPTVKPDMPVHCDLLLFLEELDRQIDQLGCDPARYSTWLNWCRERVARYPVVLPHQRETGPNGINPYHFIDVLFSHFREDEVVVCGNGTASVIPFQAGQIKAGQRMFANSGCASMGYDLPAAIGAAAALEGRRVICLAGDGSIQMNIQELQTLSQHKWPIKIFVLNNGGYLSIRSTQSSFFGRFVGESPESGVTFPDITKVAEAYGITSIRIKGPEFETDIEEVLQSSGPVLCEVMLDPNQQFEPKLSSKQLPDGRIVSAPLEDMYPFLDREELKSNLLIPEADIW